MIDFIYISFILFAALAGLFVSGKGGPLWSKLLAFFLVVTFLNETVCYFLKQRLISTTLAYNAYYYFRFPILGWIYVEGGGKNRITSLLFKFFIALTVCFFITNVFTNSFLQLQTAYLLTGGVFIIICSLQYFYNLIKSDAILNPLITPFLWVSTGFFLYFLGVLPSLGVLNILTKKSYIIASQQLIMTKSLSIVLYSLISFGFYLQWKRQR